MSKKAFNPLDIVSKAFGRLSVISYAEKKKGYYFYWCFCECGNVSCKERYNLISGNTKSCGCLRKKMPTEELVLRMIRSCMINRCHSPGDTRYKSYGGRGIKVCKRWRNSYVDFREDMGYRPSDKHSIGRIDNNKGYSPDNCRWETRKQQQRNMRSNTKITFQGKTMCIAEWAEELGIRANTISTRLHRNWSIERALTT